MNEIFQFFDLEVTEVETKDFIDYIFSQVKMH